MSTGPRFLTHQSRQRIFKSVFSGGRVCFCVSLSLAIISLTTRIVFLMKPRIVPYSGSALPLLRGALRLLLPALTTLPLLFPALLYGIRIYPYIVASRSA